jgi:hypothetical protein
VKKRLQSSVYGNVWLAVVAISAEAGGRTALARVRPFYAGWSSSVLYDIPYNVVQFTILEAMRAAERARAVRSARRKGVAARRPSVDKNMLIGGVTGALTSLLTEVRRAAFERAACLRPARLRALHCC